MNKFLNWLLDKKTVTTIIGIFTLALSTGIITSLPIELIPWLNFTAGLLVMYGYDIPFPDFTKFIKLPTVEEPEEFEDIEIIYKEGKE